MPAHDLRPQTGIRMAPRARSAGRPLLLSPLLALAACSMPFGRDAASPVHPGSARLHAASRWFDGKTGGELDWDTALARLVGADVVFLGETHTDRLTHDAELELFARLAAARDGACVLALEMFERDTQPVLDDYLAGRIDEAGFLLQSRPWGNYRTDYRGLIEHAKAHRMPVIASNFPASLRRKVAAGGEAAWNGLTAEERRFVPDRLIESPPEYWQRVDNATRGHGALGMGGGAAPGSHLYDGQNLWDNAMGEAVALARARHPGAQVIHVNGGFHSLYGSGTVWQLKQRDPGVDVALVQIGTTGDLSNARVDVESPPAADLHLVVEARARSAEDGVAAVRVGREHGYRLWVPHGAAVQGPLPLLVWLCADGQSSGAALELWKPVLGGGAAIAALDASFPDSGAGGSAGGRWWFSGGFGDGAALGSSVVARLLEVLAREDLAAGLRLDPGRVVLAGEGAAATVALHAVRYLDVERFSALAFAPIAADEFRMLSLPLPLSAKRCARTAAIWAAEHEFAAWQSFAADDARLAVTTTIASRAQGAAAADFEQIAAVARSLGLDAPAPSAAADLLFQALPPHPAGQHLARMLARRVRAAGLTAPLDLAIRPAAFADGSRLPLSSGAFGGTTIVVLPAAADEATIAAWRALEDPDVLQKRSRFHRLRIAHGERTPRVIIDQLRAENPQRRDFLLVPAVLCADAAELATLKESLGELATQINVELKTGLGESLPIEAGAAHGGAMPSAIH
jgi:uncharacterized iron-regulated protein